jgi:hypothetical protein
VGQFSSVFPVVQGSTQFVVFVRDVNAEVGSAPRISNFIARVNASLFNAGVDTRQVTYSLATVTGRDAILVTAAGPEPAPTRIENAVNAGRVAVPLASAGSDPSLARPTGVLSDEDNNDALFTSIVLVVLFILAATALCFNFFALTLVSRDAYAVQREGTIAEEMTEEDRRLAGLNEDVGSEASYSEYSSEYTNDDGFDQAQRSAAHVRSEAYRRKYGPPPSQGPAPMPSQALVLQNQRSPPYATDLGVFPWTPVLSSPAYSFGSPAMPLQPMMQPVMQPMLMRSAAPPSSAAMPPGYFFASPQPTPAAPVMSMMVPVQPRPVGQAYQLAAMDLESPYGTTPFAPGPSVQAPPAYPPQQRTLRYTTRTYRR